MTVGWATIPSARAGTSAYAEPVQVGTANGERTLVPIDGTTLPSVRGEGGAGVRPTGEPAVQAIPAPTAFAGGAVAMAAVVVVRLGRRLWAS